MDNTTVVNLSANIGSSLSTVNIIGLGFSLFNIVSTLFSNRETPPGITLVRLQAGLSIRREQEWNRLGGHVPSVVLYNEFGERFGENLNNNLDTIAEEGFADILVPHVSKLRGYPHYLSLFQPIEDDKPTEKDHVAYDLDPICIVAIWVTWPVPVDMGIYGWTGDLGASCGAQWYYSNSVVGANGFRPPCVWIGRKEKLGGFRHGGFHATPQRQAWIKEHPKVLCDSPARFSMYTYWELQNDGKNWLSMGARDTTLVMHPNMGKSYVPQKPEHSEELREQFKASHAVFKRSLVTSRNPNHSARTLCESESSLGPDLVSLSEDLFCDMSQKKLWRLCTKDGEPNCFDREFNTIHGPEPGTIVRKRDSPYHNFHDW
ncbi:hypothetical protein E0Z10_g6163 [Xylaria hypoxylon]|uniref:Uncharacterized protein n=1 Tax=Xylaria hypoxylon TaxID=37992 RepID=A0A4Z0YZ70_9PEZI|nr:hypothetical protein E0Z10_g6163 [Xylaria hypoxylon]